jgi:hypothetical protein
VYGSWKPPNLFCPEGEKSPHDKDPNATVSEISEGSEPESWESQVSDDQLKGIIKSLAKEDIGEHDKPKPHDPRGQ